MRRNLLARGDGWRFRVEVMCPHGCCFSAGSEYGIDVRGRPAVITSNLCDRCAPVATLVFPGGVALLEGSAGDSVLTDARLALDVEQKAHAMLVRELALQLLHERKARENAEAANATVISGVANAAR